MSDPLLHFASFFVALLIALGAIPFGREALRKIGARGDEANGTDEAGESVTGFHKRTAVGGFALLLGISISAFYVSSTIPNSARGLAYAAVAAVGLALFDKFARERFNLSYGVRAVINLATMMAITLLLLKPMYLESNASPLPSWLLIGVCALLPLAFARTGELTDRFAPCRSSYLFCLMIFGVLLVGLHSDFSTASGTRAVIPILAVFLTVSSALLACLFYMTDFSWRKGTITMGLLGHFVLGLTLSWAALLMASTSVRPAVTVISLTLVVAAPIYSSLAYWMLRSFGKFAFLDPRTELPRGYKFRAAALDYSMTIALVGLGLFVTWSGMHWALALLLLPASFLVCLFFTVLHSTMATAPELKSEPSGALQGNRRLDFK